MSDTIVVNGLTQEQLLGFLKEAEMRDQAVEVAAAAARAAQAAVREAKKAVRVLRKVIHRAGVSLAEFDVFREDAKRDPAELEAQDNGRGRWREWAGVKSRTIAEPPSVGPSLKLKEEAEPFQLAAEPPEEKITQEQAEQIAVEGHKAGLEERSADANPYEAGSQKGGQWLAAWKLGVSERKLRSEAAARTPRGGRKPVVEERRRTFMVSRPGTGERFPLPRHDASD